MLMGIASTMIGLLPTYETIGIAAPLLLTFLRFCQGIAIGGQWGGAMLLVTESALIIGEAFTEPMHKLELLLESYWQISLLYLLAH